MSQVKHEADYLVVRITRGGRLLSEPEGSAGYTGWLTTRQRAELEELARRFGEDNEREAAEDGRR